MCNCNDTLNGLLVVGTKIGKDAYVSGFNSATLDVPSTLASFVKIFTNFFTLQDYVGNTYLCTTATFGGVKDSTIATSVVDDGDFVPADVLTLSPLTIAAKTEGGCMDFAGGRPIHGPKGHMR